MSRRRVLQVPTRFLHFSVDKKERTTHTHLKRQLNILPDLFIHIYTCEMFQNLHIFHKCWSFSIRSYKIAHILILHYYSTVNTHCTKRSAAWRDCAFGALTSRCVVPRGKKTPLHHPLCMFCTFHITHRERGVCVCVCEPERKECMLSKGGAVKTHNRFSLRKTRSSEQNNNVVRSAIVSV